MNKPLLQVENLKKYFQTPGGTLHAVDGVSFTLHSGSTLGVVGESGCGKSTMGRAILRLHEPTSGKVIFDGTDVTACSKRELKQLRERMQIIFQDPFASINPRMTVSQTIMEPLIIQKKMDRRDKAGLERKALEIMELVGLAPRLVNSYPHELDGGRRQRIGIGRALVLDPKFIVCDEPVSALDVSIQSQVLNLLKDLQDQNQLTYLFISHDLSVVKFIADRVCVMFLGMMCEIGETEALYEKPFHPYTRFLLDAIPKADPKLRNEKKELLSGEIPSPVNPPSGCRFHTRCPYAKELCRQEIPAGKKIGERQVFCHFPLEG